MIELHPKSGRRDGQHTRPRLNWMLCLFPTLMCGVFVFSAVSAPLLLPPPAHQPTTNQPPTNHQPTNNQPTPTHPPTHPPTNQPPNHPTTQPPNHQPPTTNRPPARPPTQPTTHQPPTNHHQPPTTRHQQPTQTFLKFFPASNKHVYACYVLPAMLQQHPCTSAALLGQRERRVPGQVFQGLPLRARTGYTPAFQLSSFGRFFLWRSPRSTLAPGDPSE